MKLRYVVNVLDSRSDLAGADQILPSYDCAMLARAPHTTCVKVPLRIAASSTFGIVDYHCYNHLD